MSSAKTPFTLEITSGEVFRQRVSEDRAYWIYYISSHWRYRAPNDEKYPTWAPDAEGLRPNGSATVLAFKTEQTDEQLQECAARHAESICEHEAERGRLEVKGLTMKVCLMARAEWWEKWFNHFTFDVGQSDEEVLRSFSDYVAWVQGLQEGGRVPSGHPLACLMGAEDRWRWKGADGGIAPCRCEGCKKNGLIGINH